MVRDNSKTQDPFEFLTEHIGIYESKACEDSNKEMSKKSYDSAQSMLDKAKEFSRLQNKVKEVAKEFQEILQNDRNPKSKEGDSFHEIFWLVDDDKIRVETRKLNEVITSNLIPLPLFKKIVSCSLEIIDYKRYVKSSDILKQMEEEIKTESNYKKTPRVPVIISFKILAAEGFLKQYTKRSHRYLLNNTKSKLLKWVEGL